MIFRLGWLSMILENTRRAIAVAVSYDQPNVHQISYKRAYPARRAASRDLEARCAHADDLQPGRYRRHVRRHACAHTRADHECRVHQTARAQARHRHDRAEQGRPRQGDDSRLGRALYIDRHEIIPAVINRISCTLASGAEAHKLAPRSPIFGSGRTRMAAMTGAGMGRGCCLQYSWSMTAGPGSQ